MQDCVFCKIVKGEIPSQFEKETRDLIVINDIHPKAPTHLLIISKKHLQDIREDDGKIWNSIAEIAKKIIKERKLKGVRLVHNIGDAALVKHLHVQLLGEVDQKREV